MPRYTVTEPHPTVVKNTYTHAGRGGAGNMFRAPETTPSSGVPTAFKLPTKSSSARTSGTSSSSSGSAPRFYSGRGGAGNAHAASERRSQLHTFDEEYATAAARENVHYGHTGRGGAGNVFGLFSTSTPGGRKGSGASDARSVSSDGSASSARSGFWRRISHVTQ